MGFNHVVPHLVIRFRRGDDPFKIYGANQTRDFCYVSDAIIGTVQAMELPGIKGNIYHLGTGIETTIEELTRFTGTCMGFTGTYTEAPTYPGSVSRRCPDISKSLHDLHFSATTPWQEGIRKTVQWYNGYFDRGGIIPHKIEFL
jgi:nucleoside-diphosphate-sugar epimerase